MQLTSTLDWLVFVAGALALVALLLSYSLRLRSWLVGALLLVLAAFCAYFGMGGWLAVGYAAAGLGALGLAAWSSWRRRAGC